MAADQLLAKPRHLRQIDARALRVRPLPADGHFQPARASPGLANSRVARRGPAPGGKSSAAQDEAAKEYGAAFSGSGVITVPEIEKRLIAKIELLGHPSEKFLVHAVRLLAPAVAQIVREEIRSAEIRQGKREGK